MTLRNFPPADQCSDQEIEDLALAADANWSDACALAESPAHVAKVCDWALRTVAAEVRAREAAVQAAAALERDLAQARQHLAEMTEERDDLRVRAQHDDAARTRLGDLASDLLDDLASARTEVAALTATLDAERNERQAEVLQAGADRERADECEAAAEIMEATARAALAKVASESRTEPLVLAEIVRAVDGRLSRALVREQAISAAFSARLEQAMQQIEAQQETAAANDRIGRQLGATCEAITGKTIEQVNLELDEELAAHPDAAPLHHASDQRDHQEGP